MSKLGLSSFEKLDPGIRSVLRHVRIELIFKPAGVTDKESLLSWLKENHPSVYKEYLCSAKLERDKIQLTKNRKSHIKV